ncbi:MAG: terminase small subunit [Tissierellia bacterium]|nr:terminase small subunit [Tissierellia bacterium]
MCLKLTIKQKKFADEYIISGNAYQSAINAGYSETYAKGNVIKLLENVSVKSYISDRMKELEDKAIAKQDEVLKYLTAVLRGESKSAVVVVEGVGEGCSDARLIMKPPDEKERLKAAELLGKRYSLFTDKVDLTSDLTIIFEDDYGEENS